MHAFLWCLLVSALLLPFEISYAEDKVITWYRADFPPGFILTGPMKGEGYENYLEQLIRYELDGYKHKYQTANYSRILEQIQKGNACCVALLRKPEREEYIQYSLPTMIALANGIFILKKRIKTFKPFIDENGFISIEELFHDSQLRMGVSKGRKYHGAVDELLARYPDSKKIVVRSGSDVLKGLLEMMRMEHGVDYTIGYPHEIIWLQSVGQIQDDYMFIPIKGMPKYVISHIGCTKNKWGREVISRINEMLGGEYIEEYKKRYQKFIPPEAVDLHEHYIKEVFPAPYSH